MVEKGLVEQIEIWMQNSYVATIAYFSVTVIALVIFLSVFELVTKYNVWHEIRRGNVAVAMATGGKVFGICNIFRFAITNHDNIIHSFIWASVGFLLLMAAYFIFELLTPFFKVEMELKGDNRAIGLLSMMISVSLSFVIGACILETGN